MDKSIFEPALRENEEVLWTGKCSDFTTWNKTAIKTLLIIIVCGIFVAYMLFSMADKFSTGLITTIVMQLPLFCFIYTVFDDAKTVRKCQYALTNQRAIVYTGEYYSKEYKNVYAVKQVTDTDGKKSLFFGNGFALSKNTMMTSVAANAVNSSEKDIDIEFSFYGIDDCEKAIETIKPYCNVKESVSFA